MPKKKAGKLTAEQAAEKAKPNWRAVAPVVSDAARRAESDEAAPELEDLKRKYLGEAAVAEVKAARAVRGKPADLKIVLMEPKTASDTRVERKALVVDKDGTPIGGQG